VDDLQELNRKVAKAVGWIKPIPSYAPSWSTSVDAALELVPEGIFCKLETYVTPGAWVATFVKATKRDSLSVHGEGATPAEAICRAFLEWNQD
jgi:hypothetical protein